MRFVKKRFFSALGCLAVSAVLTWKLMEIVDLSKETTHVLQVTKLVEKGTMLESELLTKVEVGAFGVRTGILADKEAVIGKYAVADLYPGDNLTMEKLVDFEEVADNYVIKTQNRDKVAVSVDVKGISASLSGKLQVGDIVSVLVYVDDGSQGIGRGSVRDYPELKFLEIAAISNNKANDILYEPEIPSENGHQKHTGDEAIPASITFITNETQALRLVEAENTGSVHLVFRGRGEYGKKQLEAFEQELAHVVPAEIPDIAPNPGNAEYSNDVDRLSDQEISGAALANNAGERKNDEQHKSVGSINNDGSTRITADLFDLQ